MKISIENFKSIKILHNFELKPFTILSGVNSAGKSSFIQLLLLLKQTIELDSSKYLFSLKGDLYDVRSFKDIIYNKNLSNEIKVSFEFEKSEFEKLNNLKTVSIFNTIGDYKCLININYSFKNNREFISKFEVFFNFNEEAEQKYIIFKYSDNKYFIKTNNFIFDKKIWNSNLEVTNIHYSSIYPVFYEYKEGDVFSKEFIDIDDIRNIINNFFNKISYIAPVRKEPKDEYFYSNDSDNVGKKGEYVAQILEKFAQKTYNFYEVIDNENGITYKKENKTLINAVKYWMCDFFDVAENINAKKINDIYEIILTNKSGLKVNIKHVGFGISQLLPIVVEGLIMPETGTLIVEQPEIHLHPKIQSKLYDFLYSLTLQGKKNIVETHSSHFITRMRRRIAEDKTNKMDNIINLTFIEDDIFRTIKLDDFGTMDYFPKDFIEQSNTELRAIVKAQMNKRIKNK